VNETARLAHISASFSIDTKHHNKGLSMQISFQYGLQARPGSPITAAVPSSYIGDFFSALPRLETAAFLAFLIVGTLNSLPAVH
jgi:hypothetical protein